MTIDQRLFSVSSHTARQQATEYAGKVVKVRFVDENGEGHHDWPAEKPYRFRGLVIDVADWGTDRPQLVIHQLDPSADWLPETHNLRVIHLDRIVDIEVLPHMVAIGKVKVR